MFVGREGPLRRLLAAMDDAVVGHGRLVLVTGEAGMGKTSLLARASEEARRRGARVAWGTAWEPASAPAFWPWTQALRAALTGGDTSRMGAGDLAELVRLLPELGPGVDREEGTDPEQARFRLFDAIGRVLDEIAGIAPLVVVLDDLQWADRSSLLLLDFLVRSRRAVPLLVMAAYRPDELDDEARVRLASLAATGTDIHLEGLSVDEVRTLLARTAPDEQAGRRAAEVHRRTNGHPFFVRELAQLVADGADPAEVPSVVRDAVRARLARLDTATRALLDAAAVAGNGIAPDVVAGASDLDQNTAINSIERAAAAGVLVVDADGLVSFAHDLFRETIEADLPATRKRQLHRRLGSLLAGRPGADPGQVARHLTAAIPLDGPDRAVDWALTAARADAARLAFAEAASHLRRARSAITADQTRPGDTVADLLVAEADLIARAGQPAVARQLLEDARQLARGLGDAGRLGAVALGIQRLGARFAMPRDDTIAVLEEARAAVADSDPGLAAQLTASLARELHHSVPAQRPRAGPLSQEALARARELDDPATLADCLLARHDVLWTIGLAHERVAVARELITVAERLGDAERRCEGQLLVANALLESGAASFRPVLAGYLEAAERLGPRHRYYARTRRAALALIDGPIEPAEALVEEAARLGEAISEPDTGNVRMSQLLEAARALGTPDRLAATAKAAVDWWVGVPSHAYAVAAGFYARAGDLEAARRSLDVVLDLDQWHQDRSYLWGVFTGQLATAAIALGEAALCEQLLDALAPVADACAVNGAAVCFMGANAHWAGMLCAHLGRIEPAQQYLARALAVHRRLGARAWIAETSAELAAVVGPDVGRVHAEEARALACELGLAGLSSRLGQSRAGRATDAALIRRGSMWELRHRGQLIHLRDAKGLLDLAVLLSRPGVEVHVLDLAGEHTTAATSRQPTLDSTARRQYRQRLAELDAELAELADSADWARRERAEADRDALLNELRVATGLGGHDRPLGTSATERARKAVTARLRETIRRIADGLPELGAHLDRSVTTGTFCCYQPGTTSWTVET